MAEGLRIEQAVKGSVCVRAWYSGEENMDGAKRLLFLGVVSEEASGRPARPR